MLLLKDDGEILMCNNAVSRIFGLNGSEIEKKRITGLIAENDAERISSKLEILKQESGKRARIEVRFRRPSGRIGWCRFNISGINYKKEQPACLLALVEDITKQILLERQMKRAKQIAEQATKTKSEFLANMSHEIRTPIHTIIGMSELLKDTHLDEEQKEYAGQVEFSADVLLSLINDILDVEKIEAGKLKLEEIEMDLLEVAHGAVDLVALKAHEKNLEAALYIEPDVTHLVYGDPTRLRQIIVNLFNNAMKFTAKGEIELKISTAEENDDEVQLLFRVRDTGIGIKKEKMDKLFQEFSQVDSSTTRKFGGTGLGLTISKNLTRMMNGEIGAESEFGKGSTFWFTARFKKQKKTSPYIEFRQKYPDERVLIVDDNSTAREILSLYLSELGCKVVEASGGKLALEMIKRSIETAEPFTSCIIDQIMPGMDGWYLASEVNSMRDQSDSNALTELKLYMVSPAGRSTEEAKMKLLNWFSGYLNKPLKKEQLFSVFAGMRKHTVDEEPAELLPVEGESSAKVVALVAEDHEVNQQLFKSILQNLGCEVVLAANGLEAVDRAGDSAPDIIFMDCQMPEMNGYEASTEIRRLGYTVPIVAVTASAIKGEKEKCLESGMSDFLTKPFKKKDIQPILSKWKGLNHDGSISVNEQSPKDESAYSDLEELEEIEELGELAELEEIEEPKEAGIIFDFDDAVETFMGNADVVKRVLGEYLVKVDGQIPGIEKCLSVGDTEGSREFAHSIKGSALNLSMVVLGEAAKNLEYSSRDGLLDESVSNLVHVKSAFEGLKLYIESEGLLT
jgi:PAS domain S-box-containing protein